jgi:DegV family protein with EDD domain
MSKLCILTDSTAQFTRPNFLGQDLVHVIPFALESGQHQEARRSAPFVSHPRLSPPGPQEFLSCFTQLSQEFDSLLVITLSAALSPTAVNAQEAAARYNDHTSIQVVDSQTTAIGLGLLVQEAAAAASRGDSFQEIERHVRSTIPRIYQLFCIPELTYLAATGYIQTSQALVGEMMGLLPIFAMEEGRLTPLEKVRTQRHLFESFQEFMEEFEDPCHIALMRGAGSNPLRTRPLRAYVQESFPQTPFSEHPLNPHTAAMFGPQSIGLVIMENG